MTALRSILFLLWFIVISLIIHLAALPAFLLPRRASLWVGTLWCRAVLFGLRRFAGMRLEVRGALPGNGALIASKHMSMLDTIALYATLDQPHFVYRRSLERIPFFGWYLRKTGMVAIDRDGGATSLRKMAAAVRARTASGHTVVIFPEGTRKSPGAPGDYKPGVAGLYGQVNQPLVPVALNTGLFWTGPMGLIKRKGTVIVEFLAPIAPGMKRRPFMELLQQRIETATAALVAEGQKELGHGKESELVRRKTAKE